MTDPYVFAAEWIAAWNAHDLERILVLYAKDVVFLSPHALSRTGNGRVEGTAGLRRYWGPAIDAQPNLRFELQSVLTGYECLTILYRNHKGEQAAESFELDADGRVSRSIACYGGQIPAVA
jgi:hypothetical protein